MIYNNVEGGGQLVSDWGLSLWIEDRETAVLFDTGANPLILKRNLELFGAELGKLSKVVISHNHWDHIGGLPGLLESIPGKPCIFVPDAELGRISSIIPGANVTGVEEPIRFSDSLWSTGQLKGRFRGKTIYEQSIMITQGASTYLFTGCSHPGVVNIVERAKELHPDKVLELVGGGFHLINRAKEEVAGISNRLKSLEVRKLAPSHCTGDLAMAIFKEDWSGRFINLNNGDKLHV